MMKKAFGYLLPECLFSFWGMKVVIFSHGDLGELKGISLLGQAYFSKFLIEKHNPKSIKLVAICGKDDDVLIELAAEHDIEVVVIQDDE